MIKNIDVILLVLQRCHEQQYFVSMYQDVLILGV